MADSAVEQILIKVESILRTVPNIKAVSRTGQDALSINTFPAAIIGVHDNEPTLSLDYYHDWNLRLSITAFVFAERNQSKTLQAFKAAVQQTMVADPHLGIPDKVDIWEGASTGETGGDEDSTLIYDSIQYSIRYRTTLTDPYTLI